MEKTQKTLERLFSQKNTLRTLSDSKKIEYLNSCMKNLMTVKDTWVDLCANAKNIPLTSHTVGQEWLVGPAVLMRAFRILKFSLARGAKPHIKVTKHAQTGQNVAHVLPVNFYESLLFYKTHAEIFIQKNALPTQGENYQNLKNETGSLCVIMGAGNVSSMPALDVLDKLFVQQNVCLLKFNPVNDYLHDVYYAVFKNLIDDGFLELTTGDKTVGEFLCTHELTNEIHVTGSYETYRAISKYGKKLTAELGCVTPCIVVPGDWTTHDLKFHARQIASAVENNASFNCNAMKVLLIGKHWSKKEEFLECLRHEFKNMPKRCAYYPGAQERYESFLKAYPHAEIFERDVDSAVKPRNDNIGPRDDEYIPWTLIPNVDIKPNEHALNFEAFCGVLAIVEIDEQDTPNFLLKTVHTCNDFIWGNLSCTLIVDSKTHRKYKSEIEQTITNLKYGSIGVNCWAGISYALYSTTWGAFPENEVKSGIGVINNGYMFDHPEKSVVRAPFRTPLKPVWFHDHKNLVNVGKNLVNFEYSQNFKNFTRLILSALKT